MLPKLFSFTHFRKNASASPFVSHTFKTKDLKPFRITHFQKKGGASASSGPFASSTSFTSLGRKPRVTNFEFHVSNFAGPTAAHLPHAIIARRAGKSRES